MSARVLPDENEVLLTVRDVAERLRVPVSWVYEHVRPDCRDPIPHVKLGKYVRFSCAETCSGGPDALRRCHKRFLVHFDDPFGTQGSVGW